MSLEFAPGQRKGGGGEQGEPVLWRLASGPGFLAASWAATVISRLARFCSTLVLPTSCDTTTVSL